MFSFFQKSLWKSSWIFHHLVKETHKNRSTKPHWALLTSLSMPALPFLECILWLCNKLSYFHCFLTCSLNSLFQVIKSLDTGWNGSLISVWVLPLPHGYQLFYYIFSQQETTREDMQETYKIERPCLACNHFFSSQREATITALLSFCSLIFQTLKEQCTCQGNKS